MHVMVSIRFQQHFFAKRLPFASTNTQFRKGSAGWGGCAVGEGRVWRGREGSWSSLHRSFTVKSLEAQSHHLTFMALSPGTGKV